MMLRRQSWRWKNCARTVRTKELTIPEITVAEIIGKNGANIKQLTSSTGAFIDVLRPGDERNPSKNNEHIVRIRYNRCCRQSICGYPSHCWCDGR